MKKVLFVLFLCITLILSGSTSLYCQNYKGSQNYGDANEDGKIDITDALLVAMYYIGVSIENLNTINSDVNCDTQITISDSLLIARYYVGAIDQFPCESQPDNEIILGEPFRIKCGQSLIFDKENSLLFSEVESDSRCPDDLVCVWQGEVSVILEVTDSDGNTTQLSLSSEMNRDGQIGQYLITMDVEVLPPRGNSEDIIPDENYIITLTITK